MKHVPKTVLRMYSYQAIWQLFNINLVGFARIEFQLHFEQSSKKIPQQLYLISFCTRQPSYLHCFSLCKTVGSRCIVQYNYWISIGLAIVRWCIVFWLYTNRSTNIRLMSCGMNIICKRITKFIFQLHSITHSISFLKCPFNHKRHIRFHEKWLAFLFQWDSITARFEIETKKCKID